MVRVVKVFCFLFRFVFGHIQIKFRLWFVSSVLCSIYILSRYLKRSLQNNIVFMPVLFFFCTEFKECFSLYDKKQKGKIDCKDLITVMRCLGTSPTFGEIDRHLQVHKIGMYNIQLFRFVWGTDEKSRTLSCVCYWVETLKHELCFWIFHSGYEEQPILNLGTSQKQEK